MACVLRGAGAASELELKEILSLGNFESKGRSMWMPEMGIRSCLLVGMLTSSAACEVDWS